MKHLDLMQRYIYQTILVHFIDLCFLLSMISRLTDLTPLIPADITPSFGAPARRERLPEIQATR